ncbi:MAG: hypothetical protein A2X49_17050 [Lentisphaerae bacterium GWF2_52_8]|nr:MAG: hypothetical protein A2X49_17050 [Lentisphaerae bacterium GWF2_52_8]
MTLCARCVLDSSVPGIIFDTAGTCNYCKLHDSLDTEFPRGIQGHKILDALVSKIKAARPRSGYDCIIGVSGGVDSSFLLHWAKEKGLNPLAVHLDNGWDTDASVSNIKRLVSTLKLDLETHVLDWEEMRDILASFIRASFPWADLPTDEAIKCALYQRAAVHGVKFILAGHNFRTEGKQPTEWTYGDGRLIAAIHKRFGALPMRKYPNLTASKMLYYGFAKGIKTHKPFYYMDFNKSSAKNLLSSLYGWQDYGGHHHESVFTRFVISWWLPRKFGIDKRKVTFSALVRSGEMSRDEALAHIAEAPCTEETAAADLCYVLKKLGISEEEFNNILASQPRSFRDFPSYYPMIERMAPLAKLFARLIMPSKPAMLIQMNMEPKK